MFESCVNALWSAVQLSEEDTLVPRGMSSEDQGELFNRWEFCPWYICIEGCRKVSGEFVKECRDEDSHRVRPAWLLMHLMSTQTVQFLSPSF